MLIEWSVKLLQCVYMLDNEEFDKHPPRLVASPSQYDEKNSIPGLLIKEI